MACAGVCSGAQVGTSSAQVRSVSAQAFRTVEREEAPEVTIVMGLDQHRAQITAEWIDTATGEISRARVAPADRAGVRRFAARFRGEDLEVALEATTGWRFVVEEFAAIAARVHLAEPAETAARRGTKKRAKSDRADARHLRELLMVGRLPESWIPPGHLLDLRARVRLRHTLVDQRREWQQRIQAVLYHHGVPPRSWLLGAQSRLAGGPGAAAGGTRADHDRARADRRARRAARAAGPRAARLRPTPGRLPRADAPLRHRATDVGHDPRRARRRAPLQLLARGRRYAGLDITVHQSDARRAPGHLSRQGPAALRWALFEAAQCARRPASPDHDYYLQTAERLGGNRACLAVARKLLKRSFHTFANSARRPWRPHDRRSARAALHHADAPRPAPGMLLPPPPRGRPS